MQIDRRNLKEKKKKTEKEKKTSTRNNVGFIRSVQQPKLPGAQRNCAQ